MKASEIEVGRVYAVGRPRQSNWSRFEERYPGVRAKVIRLGVRGLNAEGFRSESTAFAEVEYLDGQPNIHQRKSGLCWINGEGEGYADISRRQHEGFRLVYRVPYRDVLGLWDEYVEMRDKRKQAEADAKKAEKQRRDDRAAENRALRERLVRLAILRDGPTESDREIYGDERAEEWYWGESVDLNRTQTEALVGLAEKLRGIVGELADQLSDILPQEDSSRDDAYDLVHKARALLSATE